MSGVQQVAHQLERAADLQPTCELFSLVVPQLHLKPPSSIINVGVARVRHIKNTPSHLFDTFESNDYSLNSTSNQPSTDDR